MSCAWVREENKDLRQPPGGHPRAARGHGTMVHRQGMELGSAGSPALPAWHSQAVYKMGSSSNQSDVSQQTQRKTTEDFFELACRSVS